MKSNFLALRDVQLHDLFEAISTAEQLFVEEHYHFVPTAIRLFCEGVLLTALGKTIGNDRSEQLYDLILEFGDKFNRPDIKYAANNIRKFGNKASHYRPKYWSNNELVELFKDAIKLQNFVLTSIYKKTTPATVFSLNALPDSPFNNQRGAENKSILALSKQVKLSESLNNKLVDYQEQNRQLISRLNLYKNEQRQKDEQLQALEIERNKLSQEIREAKQTSVQTAKKLQQQSQILLQQKSLEADRKNLNKEIRKAKNDNDHAAKKLQEQQLQLQAQQESLELERSVFQQQLLRLEQEEKVLISTGNDLYEQIKLEKQVQDEIVSLANLPDLSTEQKAMLAIKEGRHFLVAPPGAGKTTILTQRLKGALDRYEDSQILCLTFTTRAAEEMQNRAGKILKGRTPFIGNFHAFCLDQIRHSQNLNRKLKFFSILDDEYRNVIYQEAVARHSEYTGSTNPVWLNLAESCTAHQMESSPRSSSSDNFQRLFMDAYSNLLLLEIVPSEYYQAQALSILRGKVEGLLLAAFQTLKPQSFDVTELAKTIWSIFCTFRDLKTEGQSVDFDDILCFGLLEIIAQQQERFFIQVDEVQDLSPLQWEILHALCTEKTHLFVVGDPEQSIYGFLGADIESLDQQTKNFERHSLAFNFRSSSGIVKILNKYRRIHWELPVIQARKDSAEKQSTLLIEYPDQIAELHDNVFAVQEILKDPLRRVGILLSTNKGCEGYCDLLQKSNIMFFRVSQFDLMQKAVIQDWLSLLRVYQGLGSRKDWWRLVYRFSKTEPGDQLVTQANAISFVNQLYEFGLNPSEATSNWTQPARRGKKQFNQFEYRARQLVNSFNQQGVVIFDTETTGLNFSRARIVQIAAVRVIKGQVVEAFDRYVKLDIDTNLELAHDFKESQQIHSISLDEMNSGDHLPSVVADFFEFVGNSPLVAHNLNFDQTMLRMNLLLEDDNYHLIQRYQELLDNLQFDSLTLTRQLFPDQESYKLGDLLAAFNLDGINSHNALDDVKATASLLTHLVKHLEQHLDSVDAVLDQYDYLVQPLIKHWTLIRRRVQAYAQGGQISDLSDILIDWLEYAKQPGWYDEGSLETTKKDVELKLLPWLHKNNYQGVFCELVDERNPKVEKLFTLREFDLIDPELHRVVVSTVHRAKGLEFETVIVPQVTDSNYPAWSPDDTPEEILQQRVRESCRLLYVAISRPTDKLIISYHRRMGRWDKTLSRFLESCRKNFSWTNYRG